MKIKSMREALEIITESVRQLLVSVELPLPGTSLKDQLLSIVQQIKKEMFWKSIRLRVFGVLLSDKVYYSRKKQYKRIRKACKYVLKNKDLDKYLDKLAWSHLFETGPFADLSWAHKGYSSGDLQRSQSKYRSTDSQGRPLFGGCFERSGTKLKDNETYRIIRIVDEKTGQDTFTVERREKTPIEEKLKIAPLSTTVVVTTENNDIMIVKNILEETLKQLNLELNKSSEERIIKSVSKKMGFNEYE